jgi:hypothetical protein
VKSGDSRSQVNDCLWVYSVTWKITAVTGEWQVAGGVGWEVHGDLQMARWVYMYESICWQSISVTPRVFWPILAEWAGPNQSRPVQLGSRNIGDWYERGRNISKTEMDLTWTDQAQTGQMPDWWNHCIQCKISQCPLHIFETGTLVIIHHCLPIVIDCVARSIYLFHIGEM